MLPAYVGRRCEPNTPRTRATANPGTLDVDQHEIAVTTELKPQAASILSPEFAARLAAAKRK